MNVVEPQIKYEKLICQMGKDLNACRQFSANSGCGGAAAPGDPSGPVSGTGSPSGVNPFFAGSSCRNIKAIGRPSTRIITPSTIHDNRQSIRLIRYAAKGTRIRPPRDIPDALRPITKPRRRRNHLLSMAPVFVSDVPLWPTADTTPKIAIKYQMLPVAAISSVDAPTTEMPVITTIRTPTRSNR